MKIILGLSLAFYFYGCSSSSLTFNVEINSITDPTASPKKLYSLYSGDSTIPSNDLYFKEYCGYLRTALNSNGYKEKSLDSAGVIILVRYGIGNPTMHSYSYSLPVFGRTDAGSSTARSTSSTYGIVGNTNVSGTTTSTTTVDSKPEYGIVGANTYSGTYATYFRYLILDAIDLDQYKLNGSTNDIWQTVITSEGSSDDLRLVMPVMIVGASKYLGKNTGNKIELSIDGNDSRIIKLRNGLLQK